VATNLGNKAAYSYDLTGWTIVEMPSSATWYGAALRQD
jgi:hypothetical protein